MDFKKLVKTRATVKKYSSKKPSADLIVEAIETANLAFTHGNLHILKFIIVEDPTLIEKISESCQQEYIKTAPYIIIVCSDPKLVNKMYDVRANKYIKHHAGAVAENLLLKLCDLGLAGSWVGAFSDPTIKNALYIPDNINVELVITAGYEFIKGKKKQSPKPILIKRLFLEKYGNVFHKPITAVRRSDV